MHHHQKSSRGYAALAVLMVGLWVNLWPPAAARAFDISDERVLGRRILEQVRERMPLVDDGEVVTYVQSVGNRVTRQLSGAPVRVERKWRKFSGVGVAFMVYTPDGQRPDKSQAMIQVASWRRLKGLDQLAAMIDGWSKSGSMGRESSRMQSVSTQPESGR